MVADLSNTFNKPVTTVIRAREKSWIRTKVELLWLKKTLDILLLEMRNNKTEKWDVTDCLILWAATLTSHPPQETREGLKQPSTPNTPGTPGREGRRRSKSKIIQVQLTGDALYN